MFYLVECYMHRNEQINIITVEADDECEATEKATDIIERLPYSAGGYDVLNVRPVNE